MLLDLLSGLGAVLDTPGALVRNSISGRNPFQGLFDPEERTTGRDVLEQWGLLAENTPGLDVGDALGFGAELVTDPLNLIGLGLAAKAARASKASRAASEAAVAAGAMPSELAETATKLYGPNMRSGRNYLDVLDQSPTFRDAYGFAKDPALVSRNNPELASEFFADIRNPLALDQPVPREVFERVARIAPEVRTNRMDDFLFNDPEKFDFYKDASNLMDEIAEGKSLVQKAAESLGETVGASITGEDLAFALDRFAAGGANEVFRRAGFDALTRPDRVDVLNRGLVYSQIAPPINTQRISPLLAALFGQNALQTAGGF